MIFDKHMCFLIAPCHTVPFASALNEPTNVHPVQGRTQVCWGTGSKTELAPLKCTGAKTFVS